jgi:hypothetical protein
MEEAGFAVTSAAAVGRKRKRLGVSAQRGRRRSLASI